MGGVSPSSASSGKVWGESRSPPVPPQSSLQQLDLLPPPNRSQLACLDAGGGGEEEGEEGEAEEEEEAEEAEEAEEKRREYQVYNISSIKCIISSIKCIIYSI